MSPSLLNIFDLKEILESLFEEFFKENKSLFLVDFSMEAFKIDIKIDGDKGVKISDCIALSKHIKNHFDSELDDYNLNVSSAWRVKTSDGTNASYSIVYSFKTQ